MFTFTVVNPDIGTKTGKKPACSKFNSIQFNFYFDFVNVYMIEIHHWPANSKELIVAGQWLQLIYVSSYME